MEVVIQPTAEAATSVAARLLANLIRKKSNTVFGLATGSTPLLLYSTKNREKQRDPEMHEIRKGSQWYFGLKAHTGADHDSKLVHTVVVTAANVADITKTAELLQGQERQVHADAGYAEVEKRAEIVVLEGKIDWQIACKRGQIKALAEGAQKERLKRMEKAKTAVQAYVRHSFHIVKNLFGHRKVRYIADWPRTGINFPHCLDWPTCCWDSGGPRREKPEGCQGRR